MADSDTKHPETTVPEGDGVVCHSQTAGRKVTLARHTQENGVEHGDLEPSWRSPTRRVYTSGRPDRIVPINPSEHRQQPRVT